MRMAHRLRTAASPTAEGTCSSTATAKITACRALGTNEDACKAAKQSMGGANCSYCTNIGLDAGCYVTDVTVACTTADQITYLGTSCPTNIAAAFGNGLKLVGGVLIGIIGAVINRRLGAMPPPLPYSLQLACAPPCGPHSDVGSVVGLLCCIGLCVFC